MENRLEIYYEQIKQQQAEGPYVLFGYSAGGNLAFEVALFMESKGEVVSDIILGDSAIRLSTMEFSFKDYLQFMEESEELTNEQRSLLQNKILQKQAERRLTAYSDFLNEIKMEALIHSNIHLLLSKKEDEDKDFNFSEDWDQFTKGKVFVYPAEGSHNDLFNPPNLLHNATIINNILEEIQIGIPSNQVESTGNALKESQINFIAKKVE